VKRTDITELHFIVPIANVGSILKHGILCHSRASKLEHFSIADSDVQARRRDKPIPGIGKKLHDFANLYFDAHNPMLSRRRAENDKICVLRIGQDVLDLPGVIVSDRNAARGWARFYPVEEGLRKLDADQIFAEFWTHDDPFEQEEHKGIKCAEVLVPDRVEPRYIKASYVANQTAYTAFRSCCNLPTELKPAIFFSGTII
jgi:hypothetical protein